MDPAYGDGVRALLPFLLLAAACGSTAPYTIPAAAINSAIAVGASAAERASGGCYAVCANGTVCNPRTGYCEPAETSPCGRGCQPGEICVEGQGGLGRCVSATPSVVVGKSGAGQAAPASPVGVSPATGTVPPPPAEASPRTGP